MLFVSLSRDPLSRSIVLLCTSLTIMGSDLPCRGNELIPSKNSQAKLETRTEQTATTSDQPSLIDQLMSYRGEAGEFAKLLDRARNASVTHQILLEARFLYAVDQQQSDLPDLIPEMEALSSTFSVDQSKIFSTREDFLAVIEFCRAMAAMKKNDDPAFKQHICEAFWLSPSQAGAYAPIIEKRRLSRYLETARIDTNQVLDGLTENNKQSLSEILSHSPVILLHFWSPWNHDDEPDADELNAISALAIKYKVFVASVLVDSGEEITAAAKSELTAKPKMEGWAQWVERRDYKIATALRVTDLPTLVLLNTQGKVLYHGGFDVGTIEKRIVSAISEKNSAIFPPPAAKSSP